MKIHKQFPFSLDVIDSKTLNTKKHDFLDVFLLKFDGSEKGYEVKAFFKSKRFSLVHQIDFKSNFNFYSETGYKNEFVFTSLFESITMGRVEFVKEALKECINNHFDTHSEYFQEMLDQERRLQLCMFEVA